MRSHWWTYVARGVLTIAFAGMALAVPTAALLVLVWLFGIYAASAGIVSLVAAASQDDTRYPRGLLVLQAAAGIGAAVLAFGWPGITAAALLFLVAWWALLTGAVEIYAAVRLRQARSGEWRLAIAGAASVIFAALVFFAPAAGTIALWALIVGYALVFGTALIAHGLELRRFERAGS